MPPNTNAEASVCKSLALIRLPGRLPHRRVQVGDRDSEIRMAGVGLGRMTNRERYGQTYIPDDRYSLSTEATETTRHGSVT